MRVGVFTALLAQLSLDDVLKKLKKLNIETVELGTGNYPGDPHCKLAMLDHPDDHEHLYADTDLYPHLRFLCMARSL